MKHSLISLLLISSAALCASCGGKDGDKNAADSTPEAAKATKPEVEVEDRAIADTLKLDGTTCIVTMHRHSLSEGKVYQDAYGDKFYDNYVDIAITSAADTIFSKRFTKETFEAHYPEKDHGRCILQGVNIDTSKCTDASFVFKAQVGEPPSEGDGLYFFLVNVSLNGNLSIANNPTPDENGAAAYHGEEE